MTFRLSRRKGNRRKKQGSEPNSCRPFLEETQEQIKEMKRDAKNICIDKDEYKNRICGYESVLERQENQIESLLTDPEGYAESYSKHDWLLSVPFINKKTAQKRARKGIENRLESLKKLTSNLKSLPDNKERRISRTIEDIKSLDARIEKHAEAYARIAYGTQDKLQQESHNHKISEAWNQRLNLADLADAAAEAKEALYENKDIVDKSVQKHESRLEQLLYKASQKYDIEISEGGYRVRERKTQMRLAPALLTAAFMTGCALLYSNADVNRSIGSIRSMPLVERYLGNSDRIGQADPEETLPADENEEEISQKSAPGKSKFEVSPEEHIDDMAGILHSRNSESYGSHHAYDHEEACSDKGHPKHQYSNIPEELNELDRNLQEYAVIVDKETQTLQLYERTWKLNEEYPVSTGMNPGDKRRSGDHKTPETPLDIGNTHKTYFRISQIQDSSSWTWNGMRGAYGPWFMRLDCGRFSGTHYSPKGKCPIGIHGTPEAWEEDIGTRASHGCIRMYDEDVDELRSIVDTGTPVFVRPDETLNRHRKDSDGIVSKEYLQETEEPEEQEALR